MKQLLKSRGIAIMQLTLTFVFDVMSSSCTRATSQSDSEPESVDFVTGVKIIEDLIHRCRQGINIRGAYNGLHKLPPAKLIHCNGKCLCFTYTWSQDQNKIKLM